MNLEIRFRLPNQEPQTVPIKDRVLIGTLLSNDVVIRSSGVEPIHAMIEVLEGGEHFITDLGSQSGVKLNGKAIDVEQAIKIGDVVTIGDVKVDVLAYGASSNENFHSATTRTPIAGDIPQPKAIRLDDEAEMTNVAPPELNETPAISLADVAEKEEPDEQASSAVEDEENDEDMVVSDHEYKPALGLGTTRVKEPTQVALNTSYIETKDNLAREMSYGEEVEDEGVRSTVRSDRNDDGKRNKADQLFSPRQAKPSGDVLEVVSYWGDTVLDVELFHPTFKGYENATIGNPPKAHFLAGGKDNITFHLLANVGDTGYKLRLLDDMHARIRKGGKVGEKKGKGSVSLGKRDIAHIVHGPVKYFLMYVKPPPLALPRKRAKDPFFVGLMMAALLFYFISVPLIYMTDDNRKDDINDDIWSIVNLPEKPEPELKVPKPEQKVAEVKTPPPAPKPPKPKPQPPKPVEPKEPPKPPKPVEQPKQTQPTPEPVKKPTESLAQKAPPKPPKLDKLSDAAAGAGIVSTGAKRPDFKAPGQDRGTKKGPSGGERGGGRRNQAGGGARKGKTNADVAGVEGGAAGKASGVNLSQLGLGAGKILSKTGPGAVATDFRSSAGGAGGGSGSANKTLGLGGPGAGRSLGVSGAGGAVNNFGGFGGDGSGEGGSGGLGGAGIGRGFGRKGGGQGRAEVVVPPGDPVVSGGLTMQEVQAVIRANLNQIRHCYEQLLQRSPNASGKVKVAFQVQPSGGVGSVSITESNIRDSILQSCITGKIRRWKFPQPRGGQSVSVNYPFVFNPL